MRISSVSDLLQYIDFHHYLFQVIMITVGLTCERSFLTFSHLHEDLSELPPQKERNQAGPSYCTLEACETRPRRRIGNVRIRGSSNQDFRQERSKGINCSWILPSQAPSIMTLFLKLGDEVLDDVKSLLSHSHHQTKKFHMALWHCEIQYKQQKGLCRCLYLDGQKQG